MIVIIDYGLGNIASVANALKKLEIPFEISADAAVVGAAQALILPGVGAAGQGMKNLRERGLDAAITAVVRTGTPLLGICLGMQLLLSVSEEGDVSCLGLVPGKVKKFQTRLKVPQMGWNQAKARGNSRLFQGLPANTYFYFVHSYFCVPSDIGTVCGTTTYGSSFCSAFEQGNVFGTQFHPEKSGDAGMRVLRNFWEVAC